MEIKLSDHFTYGRLLRFTIPSILMILCGSCYAIADGVFISNFAGVTDFSAVNLMWPIIYGAASIGFMYGIGGNAAVARLLGEKKDGEANRAFSMIVAFGALTAAALAAVMFIITPDMAKAVGADGGLFKASVEYARISFLFMPAFVTQAILQNFFVAAGKPKSALYVNIAAGLTNVFLDYLFIARLNLGVCGAAAATGIGQCVGAVIPLIYFIRKNDSLLNLTRDFKFKGKIIGVTCANGSSEMVTNLSMSIINTLVNAALIGFVGEIGPAAYGVVLYLYFLFSSVFWGYSQGTAPLVSYNYGAQNIAELQNLTKKGIIITFAAGVLCYAAAFFGSAPIAQIFCAGDAALYDLTVRGAQIFSLSYILCGFNFWAPSFFTALSNGFISALLSFMRIFAFQISFILILPRVFGIDGVWAAVPAAEIPAAILCAVCLVRFKGKYKYFEVRKETA